MVPALQVEDLVVRRGGREQLPRTTLRLAVGEAVAVIGKAGSGKTTLLRAVAGEIEPTEGSVRVLGMRPGGGPGLAPGLVGFLPQHGRPRSGRTVAETVARDLARGRSDDLDPGGRLRWVAEVTGLSLDRPIFTLSRAEARSLDVARTALFRPPLLLFDDPVGDLPADGIAAVWATLARVLRDETTLLMTSRNSLDMHHLDRLVELTWMPPPTGVPAG